METEPGHDALFQREQEFFLKALNEDLDVSELWKLLVTQAESSWLRMRVLEPEK